MTALEILKNSDVCYVGSSPLLSLPEKINDDLIFYWYDDSDIGGDEYTVEIPLENLEEAKITNLGIVVKDADGEEVVIQPFKLEKMWLK